MLSRRSLALAGIALVCQTGLASGAEICHAIGQAQYFNAMQICVSSALAAQGRFSYGPQQLDTDGAAWCEGAPGEGVGETITLQFDGAAPFRTLWIENGYGKSTKAFAENARVADLTISDDRGNRIDVRLLDDPVQQSVDLPFPGGIAALTLTIKSVYPGSKYADTCISAISPDFEDY